MGRKPRNREEKMRIVAKASGEFIIEEDLTRGHRVNMYRILEDYVIGYLTDGTEFYIDKEDLPKVCNYPWRKDSNGYLKTTGDLFLHRLIFKKKNKKNDIDHIDNNPLNNRRANLRECTRQQNLWNHKIGKRNKSGISGVSECHFTHKDGNIKTMWKAYICNDVLGYYNAIEKAEKVRTKAEIKRFGEFRYRGANA